MKRNQQENKYDSKGWDCPLTPLDIAVKQNVPFSSKNPQKDILTSGINTKPPKHEFWQSRISTALISLISLSVVLGSVSTYLYFKLVPIIEESSNFDSLLSKHEKEIVKKRQENKSCNKNKIDKKDEHSFPPKNIIHADIQNKTNILFDSKKLRPIPLLLQKGQHAENIYFYRHCENLLLINQMQR